MSKENDSRIDAVTGLPSVYNNEIKLMYEIAKQYGISNFKRLGRAALCNTIYGCEKCDEVPFHTYFQ